MKTIPDKNKTGPSNRSTGPRDGRGKGKDWVDRVPEPRPVEIKEAVKLYIEDIPLTERNTIGKCIIEMRSMSERIQQFLFEFDEDGDAISERIEGASEFIEIFRMWIKGEDIEYIAEAIAQTDITIISGVLDIFGIE